MATASPEGALPIRVRIAPSPTGDPHVGTAYIALFNYVFAKKSGGRFILRIEDTDRSRYRPLSENAILEALRWIGLDWDEGPDKGGEYGPYRQSERTEIYRREVDRLLGKGAAYRCFCSAERLAELRLRQRAAKKNPGYDGHCRGLPAEESASRARAGEPHTVRLAIPRDRRITFRDRLRGDIEISVEELDDQVLLKSDGYPTYHLANVVDDHLMEISHVIRAEEWISSTPKHVLLYEAFGWNQPEWIHMPLLRNSDRSKISKRKNPVSVDYYRASGILPQALQNFLGIMGWSFGGDREIFSLSEMVEVFSWEKVSLGGPVFDQEKLRWMNEQYLHRLDYAQLADALIEWRLGREHLIAVLPLVRERIKTLAEFVPAADWLFVADLDYRPVAAELSIPEVSPGELKKALVELLDRYDLLASYDPASLEAISRDFVAERGWKAKHLFMLLRLGITGRKASPPLFDTMVAIGREMTRHRLRKLADFVSSRS